MMIVSQECWTEDMFAAVQHRQVSQSRKHTHICEIACKAEALHSSLPAPSQDTASTLADFGSSCTRTKNENRVRVNSEKFGSHDLDRFVETVRGSCPLYKIQEPIRVTWNRGLYPSLGGKDGRISAFTITIKKTPDKPEVQEPVVS